MEDRKGDCCSGSVTLLPAGNGGAWEVGGWAAASGEGVDAGVDAACRSPLDSGAARLRRT